MNKPRLVFDRSREIGTASDTSSTSGSGESSNAIATTSTSGTAELSAALVSAKGDDHAPRSAETVDISEFYPAGLATQSKLAVALDLLRQSIRHIDESVDALRNGERIRADDEIQKLLGDLNEAFLVRDIGEGYAGVVNACVNAIRSLRGKPASENQVLALGHALRVIRQKPLLGLDKALSLIEKLEEFDLSIDPAAFEALADWLTGESVSRHDAVG